MNEAMEELFSIYDAHVSDELNFGEGRNRSMGISVPLWVVELIVMEPRR